MFSIAFAAMKFLLLHRPINGRSVALGTGGLVVRRARGNVSLTFGNKFSRDELRMRMGRSGQRR
jgi:hypothetical protein